MTNKNFHHANALEWINKKLDAIRLGDVDPQIAALSPLEEIISLKRAAVDRQNRELNRIQRLKRHVARLQRYQSGLAENSAEDDSRAKFNRADMLIAQYNSHAALWLNFRVKVFNPLIYNLEMAARLHSAKTFARRLKQARKSAGLSQEQLAEKLTMKRGTFAAFEQGRNDPPITLLVQLARLLNCSADWLLGLEE